MKELSDNDHYTVGYFIENQSKKSLGQLLTLSRKTFHRLFSKLKIIAFSTIANTIITINTWTDYTYPVLARNRMDITNGHDVANL